MTEIAAVALVGLIMAAWMLYRQSTHQLAHIQAESKAHRDERRELHNRIATGQPVYEPLPVPEPAEPRDRDEYAKVGTIQPAFDGDEPDAG